MRLKKIEIINYRCFESETIDIDDFLALVGANGAGKSTVLMALNVFFRNRSAPSDVVSLAEEDFFGRNTADPIQIRCTFDRLSEEAEAEFSDYFRQGGLIIEAEAIWDPGSRTAPVKQYGWRLVMESFRPWFEAMKAKASVADLREIYSGLRQEYPGLPDATTKVDMQAQLRSFEEANPTLCAQVRSEDQFYGFSKGVNRLSKYLQWVYVPAVKDPSEEQLESNRSALGGLVARGVRSHVDFTASIAEIKERADESYQEMLDQQAAALGQLEEGIQEALRNWALPGARIELRWGFDNARSVSIADPLAHARVGDSEFLGDIVRSGHGLQRSFMLALLQVLAQEGGGDDSTLLLGFEEPEMFQHPPQAKHLASLLHGGLGPNSQVILTTHSPHFVDVSSIDRVGRVTAQVGGAGASVSRTSFEELNSRISEALGQDPPPVSFFAAKVEQVVQPSIAELLFCARPVIVEGVEDVAYLTAGLHCYGMWEAFRAKGAHFVVAGGKTNLSRPLAIALDFGLDPRVVFDGDYTTANEPGKLAKHQRDNGCIRSLLGVDGDAVPNEMERTDRLMQFRDDLRIDCRSAVGDQIWDNAANEVISEFGLENVGQKNARLASLVVERLHGQGVVVEPLRQACEMIVS